MPYHSGRLGLGIVSTSSIGKRQHETLFQANRHRHITEFWGKNTQIFNEKQLPALLWASENCCKPKFRSSSASENTNSVFLRMEHTSFSASSFWNDDGGAIVCLENVRLIC